MQLSPHGFHTSQPLTGGTLRGTFVQHTIRSENLGSERGVTVRLPDGYDPANETYPVIYLQDGQNMFDRRTGFAGQEWKVDETVSDLTQHGRMPKAILVAIDNGGASRLKDYSHVSDPEYGGGGGEHYEKFLTQELIPAVEASYSVNPKSRVLMGSSMGGLVSLAIGLANPSMFAAVGALSPSVWWADGHLPTDILKGQEAPDSHPRVWLDMGTEEGRTDNFGAREIQNGDFTDRPTGGNGVQDVRDRSRETGLALLNRGWTLDQDLRYHEPLGAGHNEGSWSHRMPEVLTWLTKGL